MAKPRSRFLVLSLAFLAPSFAAAQMRGTRATLQTSLPAFGGIPAAPILAPASIAPSLNAALSALAAPVSVVPVPAALVAVRPTASSPARSEAPNPAAAPSAREQITSLSEAPDAEALWTGAVPSDQARALLRHSRWETTRFFLGSRSVLLRTMGLQQKAETAGKPRAVRDLEGMWLDWRTKANWGL